MSKVHPLMADKKPPKRKPHRKLIFLSGFKNTGKDTVAKLIEEISPAPVKIVSFADAVKAEVYPTLGKEFSIETDDREWRDAHRKEIIAYGEGQKLEHGMFYWVKRALDDLLLKEYDRLADYPHIVVTDARRTEELMWLKYFGSQKFAELEKAYQTYEPIAIAVHRPGAEVDKDYLTHVALAYGAETRMFTTAVKNEKELKSLKQQVSNIYGIFIK